jgi:uncharacterized protein
MKGNVLMRSASVFTLALILAASALGQHTSAVPADQPPIHPITPAQVHEILELTGANQLKNQMMRGMMGYWQKALPAFVPKDVLADLESSLEKMDFEPMAVKAYQKHISTEDAAQLIAFYKTPAGRRVIAVMPQISSEMQQGGAQLGMQISQEVIVRHKDEIRAAAAKYQQDHPDTPKVTSPN